MITAAKLTKIFDGKKALDNIDLSINDGSIYGLVGSNGSGKSTFLRLAAGIYTPDGGEITGTGRKFSTISARKPKSPIWATHPIFYPTQP